MLTHLSSSRYCLIKSLARVTLVDLSGNIPVALGVKAERAMAGGWTVVEGQYGQVMVAVTEQQTVHHLGIVRHSSASKR